MTAPLLDALAQRAGYRSITTHGAQSAVARLVGVAPAQVSRAHRGEVRVDTVLAWCETAGLVVELRVTPPAETPAG
jgi:DNA-binding transcriptional regulator YdaS (Cro superfamily)